jgi:1-acyl-sn-glycerol-3-phosphate acyltransferase/nucleoside-diphosphate-sugar epimerase
VVVGGDRPLTDVAESALAEAGLSPRVHSGSPELLAGAGPFDLAVYLPAARNGGGETPDPNDARRVLEIVGGRPGCHLVLVSSAAVYQPSHHHPGHLSEERLRPRRDPNPVAGRWLELERQATGLVGETRLTVLRPTFIPLPGAGDYASRLFTSRLAVKPLGYDPSLQILSADDLAQAIRLAAEQRPTGTYNVAPEGVVPLNRGLRLAGCRRLPLPRWLQRPARAAFFRSGGVASLDQAEYIRYPWTVSDAKIRRELGFTPQDSSGAALAALRGRNTPRRSSEAVPEFDPFGMDKGYIDFYGRALFRFVHDHYWRIELAGLDNIPRRGAGVMVGVHRGFMPYDGLMTMHALARERRRYVRFLIHPTLTKFPVLGNFMTKVGGIPACNENADWVLERGGLVGVFPEGINGAFSYYRDVYRLRRFGRGEFVKMALRNRAPILPFVTVGSAEIFPILAKIHWTWWKRLSEWPCLPITPTFPVIPLPLPSKWHTWYLEPMPVHESYPPEAADDARTVQAISAEVQSRIGQAITEMRRRRRWVFWGSIFKEQRG